MPVKRIIEGGEQWLGLAESRLRAVKSIASKTGGFLKEIMQPEGADGAFIEVSVTPTLDRIWIKGSDGTDLLSGCVSPGRLIDVTENPGTPEEKTYKAVQSFYPSSLQAEAEKKGRSWRNEKKIAVEASFENKRIENPFLKFAQTADICPAQYTGKMVLAAQLAMGLKDVVIEYQHSFIKTHGIYMAGKTPWLIEISGTIRAIKLSGAKKAKNKKMDDGIKVKFPMIPDGKAFPTGAKLDEAIAKGDVRILGSANAFYGTCQPYFFDCGWAFNDDGNEAVNVGWSWPDDYKRGHLWKVTISGDSNGPTSANCSQMEQGYLFHQQSATRLHFPTGLSGEVYTFDMKRVGFLQLPPPVPEWSAPVYAFYVGNSLSIYRHKIFNNLHPARIVGWIPFDPLGGPNAVNAGSDSGGTPTLRSYYNTPCRYSSGYSAGGTMDYSGPGIPDPELSPDETFIERTLSVENGLVGAVSVSLYNNITGYPYHERCTMASAAICIESSGVDHGYRKQNSLSISPRNRSCVFIGTHELDTGGFKIERKYFLGTGVAHGTAYTDYSGTTGLTFTGSVDAGANMFYKLATGYSHAGSYSPVAISGIPSNGEFQISDSFTGVSIVGTYNTSATACSVPPGGTVSPSSPLPSIDNKVFSSRNNLISNTKVATTTEESDSFFKSFSVSPDVLGSYTYLISGYSGFLQSGYASKLPNGTSGNLIHKVAADGEDTNPWGLLQSWVGYS